MQMQVRKQHLCGYVNVNEKKNCIDTVKSDWSRVHMQPTLHRIGVYKPSYLEKPTKLHLGLLKTSVPVHWKQSVKGEKKRREKRKQRGDRFSGRKRKR